LLEKSKQLREIEMISNPESMISKLPTMLRSKSKSNKSKIEPRLLRENREKRNSKKMLELLRTDRERKKMLEETSKISRRKQVKIIKKSRIFTISKTKPPTPRSTRN
jgi:hypothetical protein